VNPDRFNGPLNQLKVPILIIGNTGDPGTPIKNARAMNQVFGNMSRLVVHDFYGHTSFDQPSPCTIGIVSAYFNNGTLPDNETLCEVSLDGLFGVSANGTASGFNATFSGLSASGFHNNSAPNTNAGHRVMGEAGGQSLYLGTFVLGLTLTMTHL